MRKSIQLLCLFVAMTLTGFAQLKQGKISYDMNFSSDNPDMAMGIAMMQGSKMSLSFMPGKSRADISMGAMGTMSTIADEKSEKALMLMDMMGNKYAMESDISKQKEEAQSDAGDYKVEITEETKEILGYKCTKAIMTSDDTETGPITMWFTKDIMVHTQGQTYFNEDMPGFPLSFQLSQGGMTIDMTVTDIEKKVDKTVFSLKVPEGYQVMTEEEMMMMGQ